MASSSLVTNPVKDSLALFLIQVVIILVLVRALGKVLAQIKQPMVIGEIIAGILLGPSAFGYIPGFTSNIFPPASLPVLSLFAQIGLIFFMFFLGLEVDPSLMKNSWKSSLPIAISSILIPFGLGSALSLWLYDLDSDRAEDTSFTSFLLFVGTALSFTAFPVLARILASTQLLSSPVGIQALSCAAIDDVLAWCTLALTLSYASGGSPINGLYTALIAVGFVLFLIFVVRRILAAIHQRLIERNDEMNKTFIATIFFCLCISSFFAEIVGIHAFFGAFAFGVMVPKAGQFVNELAPKIELLIMEFFLPLYFANSGIRTNIGSLNTGELWAACLVVTLTAMFAKVLPVTVVSWIFKRNWRTSFTLGILMNTRGLVSLIVLNIGLDLQILTPKIFTIMVIMSLITTFLTSPLLYVLYQKPYQKELAKQRAPHNQTISKEEKKEKLHNNDVSLPKIPTPTEHERTERAETITS